MDFIHSKILNKIDNLIKLSSDFDSGYKVIFNLDPSIKLDEKNIEIIFFITKNYILMRKEHGEILLMMNNLINSLNSINEKKNKKELIYTDQTEKLYDLSTFNTILNNINDLINNIDYQYKKIAIKYPKFINKKQIMIILITKEGDNKYIELINKLKTEYPENKYKIIKCDEKDKNKYEKELKEFNIQIKSIKSLPLIYVVSNSTITEIPISKIGKIDGIDELEPIKNLIK